MAIAAASYNRNVYPARAMGRLPGSSANAVTAASSEPLKEMTVAQLASLGANDKKAFFDALRPAAEAAEKKYGVPAEVTLAQAALETGWAKHVIDGFNLFGIKGNGPAGSTVVSTQEWENGHYVTIDAKFAKYNDFSEAVTEHGKLFHNGYYDKAIDAFAKNGDYRQFIDNIQGIYATDPQYSSKLNSIIDQYGLASASTGTDWAASALKQCASLLEKGFSLVLSGLSSLWKTLTTP